MKILSNLMSTIDFFKEIPAAMVVALCEIVELREFVQHDHVVDKGDAADGMYVVLTGKISIHHDARGHEDVCLNVDVTLQ